MVDVWLRNFSLDVINLDQFTSMGVYSSCSHCSLTITSWMYGRSWDSPFDFGKMMLKLFYCWVLLGNENFRFYSCNWRWYKVLILYWKICMCCYLLVSHQVCNARFWMKKCSNLCKLCTVSPTDRKSGPICKISNWTPFYFLILVTTF